jgi:hypothetical protein
MIRPGSNRSCQFAHYLRTLTSYLRIVEDSSMIGTDLIRAREKGLGQNGAKKQTEERTSESAGEHDQSDKEGIHDQHASRQQAHLNLPPVSLASSRH